MKTVDSQHERRTNSAAHQCPFPKIESKYDQITVCLTQGDNTAKLKIGATSCDFKHAFGQVMITNKTIEMGPNTYNSMSLSDTKISDLLCDAGYPSQQYLPHIINCHIHFITLMNMLEPSEGRKSYMERVFSYNFWDLFVEPLLIWENTTHWSLIKERVRLCY